MGSRRARFEREGSGLSFERLAFFTDAVYAIALTLIVVGIGIPTIQDATSARQLWDGLGDHLSEFISFGVGVLVIGFYWSSHHDAFDELASIDDRYRQLTILYLGFVAFLPFPIRLVGSYDANAISWSVLALNLACVSAMETVLVAYGNKAGLRREHMPTATAHWATAMSGTPVALFLLSIPLAFVRPFLAPLLWAASPAVQSFVSRRFQPAAVPVVAEE